MVLLISHGEFQRDMAWFNAFLPYFNGRVYFNKFTKPPITNLYVDACLTGMGGCWGCHVYALPTQTIPYLLNFKVVSLLFVWLWESSPLVFVNILESYVQSVSLPPVPIGSGRRPLHGDPNPRVPFSHRWHFVSSGIGPICSLLPVELISEPAKLPCRMES